MTDTKPKAKPGTEYIVLKVNVIDENDGVNYTSLGTTTANNDVQAIKVILGNEPEAGNYVAIPVRSFKVRGVSAATETRIVVA